MRKFKHKKTGRIAEQYDKTRYTVTYNHTEIPSEFIENSNDWEEITEPKKDYEILSLLCNDGSITYNNKPFEFQIKEYGYKIHSIKRLSDGEVFTVGDMINHIDDSKHTGIINKFVVESYGIVAKFIGKYKEINKYEFSNLIRVIEHAKKPLFKTEDGVDMYEDDIVHVVSLKHFDKEECDGENNDVIEAFTICYINKKLTKDNYGPLRRDNFLQFSTKEAAEEFILMNKPCLSINDIISKWALSHSRLEKHLKELVKSKLK